MDRILALWCNRLARRSPGWTFLSIFLASGLIWFLAAVVGVMAVLLLSPRFADRLLLVALSSAIALAVSHGIGALRFRRRPFVALDAVVPLVTRAAHEKSFPSDHAAIAFALVLPLVPFVGWGMQVALLTGATLVAVGRVLVGLHYVSDVVAGAIIGGMVWVVMEQLLH
ncbi:MAG: phosphatase PAP2 family protein [bacterium]|nr:phosphatase PAP2 family protein [bacterium]